MVVFGPNLPSEIPPSGSVAVRDVLWAGLPCCLIVTLCLSFFLSQAFTIDDAIFLRTADQATRTPAHPLAFDMCWDADGKVKRFSQFVANAPLMGYALIPIVHSPDPEIAGHILQILILSAGILATASLALRLGLSRGQALLAAMLTATCPAVLGMAPTVMPDVLAMTLGVVAIERFIAWQQERRWWSAVIAVAALALAPLARPHLALVMPVCALLCLRAHLRRDLTLIGTAAAIFIGIAIYTRDPATGSVVIRQGFVSTDPNTILRHTLSLGAYLALTSPFIAGLLVFLVRRPYWRIAAIAVTAIPAAIGLALHDYRWIMIGVSLLGLLALAWYLPQLLKLRTGVGLAFLLWAVFPFAMVVYLHMSAKYFVPSVPAYSLLLVFLARGSGRLSQWAIAALPAVGLVFGMMIVSADSVAANLARAAVSRWVPALEAGGHRVLYFGQWGFEWYAELNGAACFNPDSAASARPGDYVVVDVISAIQRFPQALYPKARLAAVISNPKPAGIVLDQRRRVGFYSDAFGRLPWFWAPAGTVRFELWKIE